MQGIKLTEAPGRRGDVKPEPEIFQELCRLWQNQPYGEVPMSYDGYIQNNPGLDVILNSGPCVTWILDMRTLHFAYLSENVDHIFGYDHQSFEESGLAYFNQIVHPEDVDATWHLVKEIWECLMALPPYQRKQHKLNISYRIVKPDGTIVQILEQNSVLQLDDRGYVTHVMGVCSDISQLEKPEDKIPAMVPGTKIPGTKKDAIFKRSANPVSTGLLSKRELQIVKLIAAGYKSRDIAEKLFISFNTVNTHRQKIIGKTHTKNTGELIRYVMNQNLI
jgi:DNA-binding CsgD family transcriptional regulator/PAS domain-containing protein